MQRYRLDSLQEGPEKSLYLDLVRAAVTKRIRRRRYFRTGINYSTTLFDILTVKRHSTVRPASKEEVCCNIGYHLQVTKEVRLRFGTLTSGQSITLHHVSVVIASISSTLHDQIQIAYHGHSVYALRWDRLNARLGLSCPSEVVIQSHFTCGEDLSKLHVSTWALTRFAILT